jgi:hypothetical protein
MRDGDLNITWITPARPSLTHGRHLPALHEGAGEDGTAADRGAVLAPDSPCPGQVLSSRPGQARLSFRRWTSFRHSDPDHSSITPEV